MMGLPENSLSYVELQNVKETKLISAPKILVFLSVIFAILTIYSESHNFGYDVLVTIGLLCAYIIAMIKQNLGLSKISYFMWVAIVVMRFMAYVVSGGQFSKVDYKVISLVFTAVFFWIGIRGLMIITQTKSDN
ncbi:MAG: hypothetical protein PHP01_08695 [Phycisphaerae bacterium]|nr:hypothetical protein [Phycisphaerae bacterium]